MKRPLTLTASILATVFLTIEFIFEIISFIAIINTPNIPMVTEISIISIVLIVLLLVSLILNICMISSWNKSTEIFIKRKPALITTIVFNFICVLLYFIYLVAFVTVVTFFVAFIILTVAALIASNVLYIIDIAREGTKNKGEDNVNNSKYGKSITSIESKIAKLLEMKNKGILSEEEYSNLKQKYIQDELK